MRSSYNKSESGKSFDELNTRPPGYKDLAERMDKLEQMILTQHDMLAKLIEERPSAGDQD